jgi:Cu(I)/Ag(I) efflux system membrane fusion protein
VPGEIMYDPNSSVNVAARISGRIEKMYVHYMFQKIRKGQKLFDLYSPELATEQQNFIYLVTNDSGNNAIINAAKQKLALYGMTVQQISTLAISKKSNPIVTIYSPANGIVQGTEGMQEKQGAVMNSASETTAVLAIKEGDYIQKNAIVFRLMNTDKVWGVFNVPQGKSGLVKANQAIQIKTEIDDEAIPAKVNFVETQLNATDKTNRIRVYLNNVKTNFPIGLRLEGSVSANPAKGMWLPKVALVSTGNNKVVFVKMDGGFKAKLVQTGIAVNDFVQIVNGLSAADAVVENAQYLMDSETFIKATR